MGLGGLSDISLKKARQLASKAGELKAQGIDPLQIKREERAARLAATAQTVTFRKEAEAYLKAHGAGWKNPKHAEQWRTTLERYAYPLIGEVSITDIDTTMVANVLEPLWSSKTETSSRLRGRQ